MQTKNIAITAIIAIIVGAGAFYSGIKYGQSKNQPTNAGFANFQNMAPGERQRFRANADGGGQGARRFGGQPGSEFISGKVIKTDDSSATLELRDGGSKIIFFSDTTDIMKSGKGETADIKEGENLIVSGKANQDGSLAAESIQIRPEISNAPEGNTPK